MIYDVHPICSFSLIIDHLLRMPAQAFSMNSYLEFSFPFLPHSTHLSNFYGSFLSRHLFLFFGLTLRLAGS